MNLRQLKTLCEIVDRGLRVSDAARATYRSQSSVTRQIQLLEKELGCELFVRKRNKLLGMSTYGLEILAIARRIIQDSESMHRIAQNAMRNEAGDLTIATTNFQAKFVLPSVIRPFVKKYPSVRIVLRQGTPAECANIVTLGKADFAICAAGDMPDGVVALPCYRMYRAVLTPMHHPLLKVKRLTLGALAEYPLISYDEAFNGAYIVNKTFLASGITPNVVITAVDADVSKIYVEMGLGIAITPRVAFQPKVDVKLRRIDARHLFKPSDVAVILRARTHLRKFMFDFVQMFSPILDQRYVEEALFGKTPSPNSHGSLPEL